MHKCEASVYPQGACGAPATKSRDRFRGGQMWLCDDCFVRLERESVISAGCAVQIEYEWIPNESQIDA